MSKINKMLMYTLAKFVVNYTKSKPAQASMSNQSNMQLVVLYCSVCSLFFKAKAATSKHIKTLDKFVVYSLMEKFLYSTYCK